MNHYCPETGPRIAVYFNTRSGLPGALRWWADDRIIVGGSILHVEDGENLRLQLGVTHVISVESERGDFGMHTLPWIHLPTPDIGRMPVHIVRDAITWARGVFCEPNSRLYVHCQQGMSRSPSIAYAILRDRGLSHDEIIRRIREAVTPDWGAHPFHVAYLTSADRALASLKEST